MPANTVYFLDTSVFVNLLRVPGMSDAHDAIAREFERRIDLGAKFVLPVTTLIETGNHISGCAGDRRGAALRYVKAIGAARTSAPPWTIRDIEWGEIFLRDLLAGDSTGSPLEDLLSAGSLGTGDVSILVERDRFLDETAFNDVRIWTLDAALEAHDIRVRSS